MTLFENHHVMPLPFTPQTSGPRNAKHCGEKLLNSSRSLGFNHPPTLNPADAGLQPQWALWHLRGVGPQTIFIFVVQHQPLISLLMFRCQAEGNIIP